MYTCIIYDYTYAGVLMTNTCFDNRLCDANVVEGCVHYLPIWLIIIMGFMPIWPISRGLPIICIICGRANL